MPLHEYTCQKCTRQFEVLVATRETPKVACPDCASESVDRLFGLPARPTASTGSGAATNCEGNGPPCGAPWCGRK